MALAPAPAVLVAVDGGPYGWEALSWAAADAAAGRQPLRIVHVVNWRLSRHSRLGPRVMRPPSRRANSCSKRPRGEHVRSPQTFTSSPGWKRAHDRALPCFVPA